MSAFPDYDVAVIGAGIAGASIAAELAPHARVLIAEAEDTPGYHTTGRSAAFFHECYGGPQVAPLSLASGPMLRERGVLSPRGSLYIARAEDAPMLEQYVERFAGTGVAIERLGRAELERRIPGLRPAWTLALPLAGTLFLAMTWTSALRYAAGERSRWKGRSYRIEPEGANGSPSKDAQSPPGLKVPV